MRWSNSKAAVDGGAGSGVGSWLRLNPKLGTNSALLPNRDSKPMTRNNVTQRLALAVKAASQDSAS